MGFTFNDTAVITNDLCYECKTEASSRRFVGYKGIEEMGGYIGGHAGSIVMDADFERQTDRRGGTGGAQPDARPEGRGQLDLAINDILA